MDSDPEKQVDFADARFSDATEELVATYYDGDRLRTYPRDAKFKRDYELVRQAFPDGRPALPLEHPGRPPAAGDRHLRRRPGRGLPLRPQDRQGRVALPPAAQAAHPAPGPHEAGALPGARRRQHPGLPHHPQGGRARGTCRWCSTRTAVPGRATRGATTAWRSSSPTGATPCCSPTSAARSATARSSSTSATSSGARGPCSTISPTRSSGWSTRASPTPGGWPSPAALTAATPRWPGWPSRPICTPRGWTSSVPPASSRCSSRSRPTGPPSRRCSRCGWVTSTTRPTSSA